MFSFTSFSSTPYSALGETLVEMDANLENFCLIDGSSLISIFPESYLENNIELLSFAKNRFYSSYDFLGNSILDLDSKIKNYNLSNFDFRLESLQNAIIKLNNYLSLDNNIDISNESIIKLRETASLPIVSNFNTNEKIKFFNSSNLAIEAVMNYLQREKIQLESDLLLNDVASLLSISSLKTHSNSFLNFYINSISNGIIKVSNSINLDNLMLLNATDKILVTGNSLQEYRSEFLVQYLNKTNANGNFDSRSEAIVSSILKNFNLIDLNNITEFVPFITVLFGRNEALLEINSESNLTSSVKTFNNSSLNTESEFLKEYLIRVIGDFSNDINSELLISPSYKTFTNSTISSNINLSSSSKIKFYDNLSDMKVIGVITTNLSQRNRDIVYYILAIDQERPFELKILRSK